MQFKQLQINPKKKMKKGIRTHGLCVSAAVLYHLSYEDPYIGSRPICWVHLNPWKEWNMKMMWTAEIHILNEDMKHEDHVICRNTNFKWSCLISVNKPTGLQLLVLADFIICFPPEKQGNISFIPSILKRVQRWRVTSFLFIRMLFLLSRLNILIFCQF